MKAESRRRNAESRRHKAVSRKQAASDFLPTAYCRLPAALRGFSLIELVITVAVLAILTLAVIPLVQVSVKRQKEQQLHDALREMREAIDQFHREALAGVQMQANQPVPNSPQQEQASRNPQTQNPQTQNPQTQNPQGQTANIFADPRVRVAITDQAIFTADNVDRYPPDLKTLVDGVNVLPIAAGNLGRRGNLNYSASEAATQESLIPKIKIYLRRIPIDPMTGKDEWEFRSCYDAADATNWGGENIFDVHSKSDGVALNGEKYRDW